MKELMKNMFIINILIIIKRNKQWIMIVLDPPDNDFIFILLI